MQAQDLEPGVAANPFGMTPGQIAAKVVGWTATGAVADVITSRINRWITYPVTRAAEGAIIKGAGAVVGNPPMSNPPMKACDPSKRPLKLRGLKGQYVRTHVNLHNGCYVVSFKSKVQGYTKTLRLRDVRPRVGQAGWHRCKTDQVRNVHAYLDGELVSTSARKTGRGWREISYHCKSHGPFFFYTDTDEPFEGATEMIARKIKKGGAERAQVLVRGPVPARKNPSCPCGAPKGVCSCGEVDSWIEGDPEKITPCGAPPKQAGVHLVRRPWGVALLLLDVHNLQAYGPRDWHRGRCPLLAGFSVLDGYGTGTRVARDSMWDELEFYEGDGRAHTCPALVDLAARCQISLAEAEDELCREGVAWHSAVRPNPAYRHNAGDPRKEVYRILKEIGAQRERDKKHDVWLLPNRRKVTFSKTSSDWRAWKNALADLRRTLRLPPPGPPSPMAPAPPEQKGKKQKKQKKGQKKTKRKKGKRQNPPCTHRSRMNPCPACIAAAAGVLGASAYLLGEDAR
jgi:hypothetical protein